MADEKKSNPAGSAEPEAYKYIDDDPGFIPNAIRRASVVDGLVNEARRLSNTRTNSRTNSRTISRESVSRKESSVHAQVASNEAPKPNDDYKDWKEMSKKEKFSYIFSSSLKSLLAVILLYMFLISLSFMSIGFTLVTSYALQAGEVIKYVLSNPFAALCIGIIATALMQNATATTSIAVIMAGAGIIPDVKSAVPIIMGANIGTCVTNSFIALTLAGDPQEFKRAFSAATLNDGFNLMTTSILLPIEIVSGFLFFISDKITNLLPLDDAASLSSINFINAILTPVTDVFILLNSTAVDLLSGGDRTIKDVALRCCRQEIYQINITQLLLNSSTTTTTTSRISTTFNPNRTNVSDIVNATRCLEECKHWCMPMLKAFGDGGTGLFWILFSLFILLASLFGIVKVFSMLIVGPIAKVVTKALNASFPGKFKWLTQVVLFLVSFGMTIIVQSSNIITATLVPLCGIGIISLQKVYVMTLGSNIGTTVTGILTAFTQPPSAVKKAMQLAFVYTFFNSFGVLFWLPIPYLRFPKRYARKLGNTVFEYRWLLYVYVSGVYLIIPLIVFLIALIPMWIGLAIVGIPLIIFLIFIVVVLILRKLGKKYERIANFLPEKLKNFDWLPIWFRSLKPYDEKVKNMNFCCCKKKTQQVAPQQDPISVINMNPVNPSDELPNYADISPTRPLSQPGSINNEQPGIFPSTIRRVSVFDGLIAEAVKKKILDNNANKANDSSSEEEHDSEVVKNFRRRKSRIPKDNRSLRSVNEELEDPESKI